MRDDLPEETPSSPPTQANVQGAGAIAQGERNAAAGANGVAIGELNGNVIFLQPGAGPVDPEMLSFLQGERRPPADLTRATARYLEYLVEYYRYLDFRGMGVSDRIPLRLPLLEMYVPLKARMETPDGETWGRDLRLGGRAATKEEIEGMGERLSGPLSVLDLLRKHDGLILLGDPGAGKTTFLKFLALALATGQGEAIGLGSRLPVLLPLSAYANALEKGEVPLEKFIGLYYQNDRGIGLPLDSMLRRGLEEGGVLLLLDGLDEVRDRGRRHLVVDRVRELYTLHRKAGNKLVLTSRIVGYREVRPESEGLAECTLVDFEDDDIQEFVGKWTKALEKAASGQTRVAVWEAEREKTELLRAVKVRGFTGTALRNAFPLRTVPSGTIVGSPRFQPGATHDCA